MRLMLHIFKKDARRLWWEIAVSMAVLAVLAGFESLRTDAVPGSLETFLTLVVPAVWAFVVVLVIQGEGPVGDRQFWVTRPYPRGVLLGAKALALVAFIHVPSFVADCAILVARGFNPLGYLPALFAKQVTLAIAVTVPAAALAAVTRNLVQFVPAAVVVVGAVIFVDGTLIPPELFWTSPGAAQRIIPLVCAAVAGAAILSLQYFRRRANLARGLAVAALLAAGLIYIFIPREYVFRTQCALWGLRVYPQPASTGVVIVRDPVVEQHLTRGLFRTTALLSIPVQLSGMDQTIGASGRYSEQLDLEVIGMNGAKWKGPYFSFSWQSTRGRVLFNGQGRASIFLMLDRAFYDRIEDAKVTIRGRVGLTFYRRHEPVRMPALSASKPVPALGRCSSFIEERYGMRGPLKTLCESPNEFSGETSVNLIPKGGGRSWEHQFAESSTMIRYSPRNWLSPLYRAQARFNLADRRRAEVRGSQWLVPRDVPSQGEIEVVPAIPSGAMILSYELRDVDLRQFAAALP
jgi:hypothetical protein